MSARARSMTMNTSFSSEHPYATAYQPRGFSLSSGESFSDRMTNVDSPTFLSSNHASSSTSTDYSRRNSVMVPPSKHTYTLRPSSQDVPLMAVHLDSWASETSDDPTYAEGQFISGSVDLNLRTPDRIKAVIVSVDGYYVIPGFESKTFMHVSETVWNSEDGYFAEGIEHSRKLVGKHSWSFKFTLPRTLEISAKEEKKLGHGSISGARLPPSFRQKHTEGSARIGYELVVRIKRPTWRLGHRLSIPISYMTATRPPPCSFQRQIAYKKLIPAPSFDLDPDGWRILPEIEMRGTLAKTHISFNCTLALALPLNYARGSFIPCALRITSKYPQVLDHACHPTAPRILLKRGFILRSRIGGELGVEGQDKIVAQAHWIAPEKRGNSRVIHGEIPIPTTTSPSFAFGRIETNYEIFVMPFDIPGFVPAASSCFLRLPVTISTFLPEGPMPQSLFVLPY